MPHAWAPHALFARSSPASARIGMVPSENRRLPEPMTRGRAHRRNWSIRLWRIGFSSGARGERRQRRCRDGRGPSGHDGRLPPVHQPEPAAARTWLHLQSDVRQPSRGAGAGAAWAAGRRQRQAVPLRSLRPLAPGSSASPSEETDYVIGARDTSVAAREAQLRAFRRLSPSERMALACQMSEEARRVAVDGLRHRHPEMSGADAEDVLRRLGRSAE